MATLDPNAPVKLVISDSGVNPTHNGFALHGFFHDRSKVLLYQYVDLHTYPSNNDFFGESYPIDIGEIGIVISYVGRPIRISRDPVWCQFDLYEVLFCGKIVQVFRQNIEPIKTS